VWNFLIYFLALVHFNLFDDLVSNFGLKFLFQLFLLILLVFYLVIRLLQELVTLLTLLLLLLNYQLHSIAQFIFVLAADLVLSKY